MLRPFFMIRKVDHSGVSGVGKVAEGVVFSNGKVVLHWLTETSSIVIYDSVDDTLKIHGHGGSTEIHYYPRSVVDTKNDEPSTPPNDETAAHAT